MNSDLDFKFGYVVGRFIDSRGDSSDADRLPDAVNMDLRVKFTRTRGQYVLPTKAVYNGITGVFVNHEVVVARTNSEGMITSDLDDSGIPLENNIPGVWLVVGQYKVDFDGVFPSITIEVVDKFTESSPLDLSTAVDYTPPPGMIVNTIRLPSGGSEGQVYGWTGSGVGWYTPESGSSAYEIALQHGFVGSEDEWLASLKGSDGFYLIPDTNIDGLYVIKGRQILSTDSNGLLQIGDLL